MASRLLRLHDRNRSRFACQQIHEQVQVATGLPCGRFCCLKRLAWTKYGPR